VDGVVAGDLAVLLAVDTAKCDNSMETVIWPRDPVTAMSVVVAPETTLSVNVGTTLMESTTDDRLVISTVRKEVVDLVDRP